MASRKDTGGNDPANDNEKDFFGVKISPGAEQLFDLLDHFDPSLPDLGQELLDTSKLDANLAVVAMEIAAEINLGDSLKQDELPELKPSDLECLDMPPDPIDGAQLLRETTIASNDQEDDFEPEIVFENITKPYHGQSGYRHVSLTGNGGKLPEIGDKKTTKCGHSSHRGNASPSDEIEIVFENLVDPKAGGEVSEIVDNRRISRSHANSHADYCKPRSLL